MKVIKVGATWCSGCLVMKPRWQEIEAENPWLETEYYDFDDNPEIAAKYKIDQELPVAILVDSNENEITRLCGEINKDEIQKTILAQRAK